MPVPCDSTRRYSSCMQVQLCSKKTKQWCRPGRTLHEGDFQVSSFSSENKVLFLLCTGAGYCWTIQFDSLQSKTTNYKAWLLPFKTVKIYLYIIYLYIYNSLIVLNSTHGQLSVIAQQSTYLVLYATFFAGCSVEWLYEASSTVGCRYRHILWG